MKSVLRPGILVVAILLPSTALIHGLGVADSGEKRLYEWRDAAGQVHFSDRPPPEGASSVQSYLLPRSETGAEDDYYSVENQAQRLEDQRRALAEEREATRVREEERALRDAQLEAARAVRQQAEREAWDRRPVYLGPSYPVYPFPPIAHPIPPIIHPPIHRPERPLPPKRRFDAGLMR